MPDATPTVTTTKLPATTAATKPAIATPSNNVKAVRAKPEYKKSTLERSHIDQRFSPRYEPIKILFLTGTYAGQYLDLGTNSVTLTESQSTEWEYASGDTVRPGCNFKTISTREFNLDLDYYDLNEDVRQLVEGIFHTHEIGDASKTPPDLQIISGTATISPIICRRVDPSYDLPLPNNRGYRHATVRVTLELRPEPGSPHDLAPVLSPTYLTNYKQRTTAIDRAKSGAIARTKALLDPCLGEEGSKKVSEMMKSNELGDPDKLLELDGSIFLQLVAAGLPSSVMEDPRIKNKIAVDLAVSMTKEEDGMNPTAIRDVAQALVSGNTGRVPAAYLRPTDVLIEDKEGNRSTQSQSLFEMMKGDYDIINGALTDQKLGPEDPVFDRTSYPTASQRMMGVARCGIQLRNVSGPLVADRSGTETATLSAINDALANSKVTDDEIKELFGLPSNTPETVMRQLRGNGPYDSKEKFLDEAAPNRQGFTAYNMWSAFSGGETQTLSDINAFIAKEETTAEEIAKAFKISKEEAQKLKDAKQFTDKASFVNVFGEPGTTAKGQEAWTQFKLKGTEG